MGTQKQGNGFELGLRIRSGVEMGRGGKSWDECGHGDCESRATLGWD